MLIFLKQCACNNITPQHLNTISNFRIKLHNHRSNHKFSQCKKLMIKKVLHLELNDAYRQTDFCRRSLFHMVSGLSCCLPTKILDDFLITQEKSCNVLFRKERERDQNKNFYGFPIKRKHRLQPELNLYRYKYDTCMCAGPTFVHKDTLYDNPSLTLSPSTLISIHPSSFSSQIFFLDHCSRRLVPQPILC